MDIEWTVQIDGRVASIGTLVISRLYMAQLLECVTGIAQELAEEDFIVGIEGMSQYNIRNSFSIREKILVRIFVVSFGQRQAIFDAENPFLANVPYNRFATLCRSREPHMVSFDRINVRWSYHFYF